MADEPTRRLTRSRDHLVGGVAGGIAEYFDLDPTIVRLGFVALALFGFGGTAVAYIILWIVVPPADAAAPGAATAPRGGQGLLVALAVVLVIVLAGGFAWFSMASLHLFWLSLRSLPLWIVLLVIVWLLLRSRGSQAS